MELKTRAGLSTGSREAGRGEVWAEMTAGEQPAPWEWCCCRGDEGITGAGMELGGKRARLRPTTFQTRTATDPSCPTSWHNIKSHPHNRLQVMLA